MCVQVFYLILECKQTNLNIKDLIEQKEMLEYRKTRANIEGSKGRSGSLPIRRDSKDDFESVLFCDFCSYANLSKYSNCLKCEQPLKKKEDKKNTNSNNDIYTNNDLKRSLYGYKDFSIKVISWVCTYCNKFNSKEEEFCENCKKSNKETVYNKQMEIDNEIKNNISSNFNYTNNISNQSNFNNQLNRIESNKFGNNLINCWKCPSCKISNDNSDILCFHCKKNTRPKNDISENNIHLNKHNSSVKSNNNNMHQSIISHNLSNNNHPQLHNNNNHQSNSFIKKNTFNNDDKKNQSFATFNRTINDSTRPVKTPISQDLKTKTNNSIRPSNNEKINRTSSSIYRSSSSYKK